MRVEVTRERDDALSQLASLRPVAERAATLETQLAAVRAEKEALASAKAAFERLIARGNDVGLFAEEIDPATGAQRGNTPQGFSHMALINAALRLEDSIERFGLVDPIAQRAAE